MKKYFLVLFFSLFIPLMSVSALSIIQAPSQIILSFILLLPLVISTVLFLFFIIKIGKMIDRKSKKSLNKKPIKFNFLEIISLISLGIIAFSYFFKGTCNPKWLGDIVPYVESLLYLFSLLSAFSFVTFLFFSIKDKSYLKMFLWSIILLLLLASFIAIDMMNSSYMIGGSYEFRCLEIPAVTF